jgi:hypothetical protein
VHNYNEDTKDLPEARVNFVKYTFVPGIGFYDIGLMHILGNTTNAVESSGAEKKIEGIIKEELGELKKKYGDERRTDIVAEVEELEVEDLIAEEDVVVSIAGYSVDSNPCARFDVSGL